jgi:hypothetical protein
MFFDLNSSSDRPDDRRRVDPTWVLLLGFVLLDTLLWLTLPFWW